MGSVVRLDREQIRPLIELDATDIKDSKTGASTFPDNSTDLIRNRERRSMKLSNSSGDCVRKWNKPTRRGATRRRRRRRSAGGGKNMPVFDVKPISSGYSVDQDRVSDKPRSPKVASNSTIGVSAAASPWWCLLSCGGMGMQRGITG